MKTLSIEKELSLAAIEHHLKELTKSEETKLRLPNKIKYSGGFGTEAALTQLIATWARNQKEPTFHTYVDPNEKQKGFSSLCESFYGMAALALSRKILCLDGTTQVHKSESLQAAIPRIAALKNLELANTFKGFKVDLPCIKSGSFSGLIEPLYNNEKIVNQTRFEEIIEKSIESIAPQKTTNWAINKELVSKISQATRQLFLNTDEHARHDESGNEYARDVRGILLKVTSHKKAEALRIADQNSTLKNYFNTTFENIEIDTHLRFLEITVLDSGPGFSGRWLRKNSTSIDHDIEAKAILNCFEKHSSSKSSPSSGIGLDIVLNILSELNGWFRLRTGNTIIEKAFTSNLKSYHVTKDDIKEAGAHAYGSVFTFIIPLFKNN